jgi:hypothetical protein
MPPLRRAALLLPALASLAVLAPASASRLVDVPCPAACTTDLDCSLNGVCGAGGVCACDAAWTGPCCTALSLLPVSPTNSSYRHPSTSTWGGNILVDAASGTAHMWIAEMAPNGTDGGGSCGLTTWAQNSQVTHVTAPHVLGPYARAEVAVGVWSHNPLVRAMPDGTLVMWHIGGGGGGAPGKGYCGENATSPCGEQGFDNCGAGPASMCGGAPQPGYTCFPGYCSGDADGLRGDCGADLAEPTLQCESYDTCAPAAAAACAATPGCASFALSDAWGLGKAKLFSAGPAGLTPNAQWATWVSGGHDHDMYARARAEGEWPVPPPAVAPDGSCTLTMHTASSVDGPWTPYTNATITPCGGNNPAPWVHPNGTVFIVFTDFNMGMWRADTWRGPYTLVTTGACGGGEDPSLYLDAAGRFHCLFHRSPFSNPDIAIGHAYSLDGLHWYAAADPAANSSIAYAGGLGVVVHGKRERPHLYFGADGRIAALVSGVCINPACDPLDGGAVDPSADCSSGGQYYKCDANSPDGWYDRTYTLVQGVAGGQQQ